MSQRKPKTQSNSQFPSVALGTLSRLGEVPASEVKRHEEVLGADYLTFLTLRQ